MNIQLNSIHTFWYNPNNGNTGNNQDLACIMSWLHQGKKIYFWTYGKLGYERFYKLEKEYDHFHIMDAEEVIPIKDYIVANYEHIGAHGYALFSDIFRYKVLDLYGGWWLDTDFILINDTRKLTNLEEDFINARVEHKVPQGPLAWLGQYSLSRGRKIYNNGAIYCESSNLMKETYERSLEEVEKMNDLCKRGKSDEVIWGNTGPTLITNMIHEEGSNWIMSDEILPFYAIDCYAYTGSLPRYAHTELKPEDVVRFFKEKPVGVHLWNSYIHKSGGIHPKSFFAHIMNIALSGLPVNATNVIQQEFDYEKFIDLSIPNHNIQ